MKKLFTFLFAALMSAGMWADPNIVTPTISGETEFTDSVVVTMTCPSPDADIYYTIDGVTDPRCDCSAAPEYTHPITITETTTIKAAAFDGNDWSAVAEVTFTKVPAPADPNREYLSLDPSAWTWGYNSVSGTVADGLQTTIISDWGALSMGWDPERDLSEWDKIVFEVSHMDGCDGQWFKLKAYLRDITESEPNQMEGLLGLDAPDNQLNYLVIDLHQNKACDLTKARILAVQCEPTGGIFTISSAYLLKEEKPEPLFEMSYEDKWLNIAPADTVAPYVIFVESKEYYEAGKEEPYSQDKLNEEMDLAITALKGQSMLEQFTFVDVAGINPKAMMEALNEAPVEGSEYVFLACYITDDARSSDVEYTLISYAGDPTEGIENIVLTEQAQKVIVDGVLYIVRDGKLFNLTGAQVR